MKISTQHFERKKYRFDVLEKTENENVSLYKKNFDSKFVLAPQDHRVERPPWLQTTLNLK